MDSLLSKNFDIITINDEDETIYVEAHHQTTCWRYYNDNDHVTTIDLVRLRHYWKPIHHTRFFSMLNTIKSTGSCVNHINMLVYHLKSYKTNIRNDLIRQVLSHDDNPYIRHICLYVMNDKPLSALTWFSGNGKLYFIDRFEAMKMFDKFDRYVNIGYNPIAGNEVIANIIMMSSIMYPYQHNIESSELNMYLKWCNLLGANDSVCKKIISSIV